MRVVSKNFKERLNCVCSKSVKVDDAVIASRLADKFDLRSREERVYCKGCREGKRAVSLWLLRTQVAGAELVEQRHFER